jgi:hypothetical protein
MSQSVLALLGWSAEHSVSLQLCSKSQVLSFSNSNTENRISEQCKQQALSNDLKYVTFLYTAISWLFKWFIRSEHILNLSESPVTSVTKEDREICRSLRAASNRNRSGETQICRCPHRYTAQCLRLRELWYVEMASNRTANAVHTDNFCARLSTFCSWCSAFKHLRKSEIGTVHMSVSSKCREPRRLTTLWASTACYGDSFTFFAQCN